MRIMSTSLSVFFFISGLLVAGCGENTNDATTADEPIRVAVAANFAQTLRDLAEQYEAETGQTITISVGSTGSLYSQIEQGAPFDLFFAADNRRPEMLESAGRAVPGTRRTYAQGRLVLWSPDQDRVKGKTSITAGDYQHLAIANPVTAPYGLAAKQTLTQMKAWDAVQPRLVQAQSIGQAFEFVRSGSAELGFVALSQIQKPNAPVAGSQWMAPADMYEPIRQQVVILVDRPAVRAFWQWVTTDPAALKRIRAYGYEVTPATD